MGRCRQSNRRSLISTCILVLIFCLFSVSAFIATAIAAEPWPCTTSTEIGGNLPLDYEPSGLDWSPALNSLFLVSDSGRLTQLDTDGNIASDWAIGGDLEGVALAEGRDSFVYLGIEHPDSIEEFNLSTGALTGHSWSLTTWMTGADNSGLEALAFVPNGYHPYDSSASGGLFYAGLQADGKIYVFNVDLSVSGSVSHVATLTPKPGITDISGLHFCTETNVLYAVYDGSNLMVEMQSDGTVVHEYSLPGNDQEGVTVIPSSDGDGQAYVAEDVGPELWRYEPYPTLTRPEAPTNVSATEDNAAKVTITWTKSMGATDYHVWRGTTDL
ncbi:MAG: SdiA-regulated domain-containing protein, partial [Candidatus Geothermincolia bacterium]